MQVVVRAKPQRITGCQKPAEPATFANPIYSASLPDPFVLREDETYHAYSTNDAANVPTLRSGDLIELKKAEDAMHDLAPWVTRGQNWAWRCCGARAAGTSYTTRRAQRARAASVWGTP